MCGIIGYVGKKSALPIVVKGLEKMEYRGYDSLGVLAFNKSDNLFLNLNLYLAFDCLKIF